MTNFKEIVTKAILKKVKKSFTNKYEISLDNNIDTVLGCWIINHTNQATIINDMVNIVGSFDVNMWYSCESNTKTNVVSRNVNYEHNLKIEINDKLNSKNNEIIIRNLKNPTCIDVNVLNNTISYTIEKELGIELIGDTTVKIAVIEEENEYESLNNDISEEEVKEAVEEIDEVKEEYLG